MRPSVPQSGRAAVVVLVAIVMFAAGAGAMYYWLQMSAPARPPSPSPQAVLASPVPSPSSEPAPSPAEAGPAAAPSPQSETTQVTEGPATPPRPRRAGRGRAPMATPAPDAGTAPVAGEPAGPGRPAGAVPRTGFVAGRTAVESLKKVPSELEGFDTTGVGVKRAPAVTGRLELEMSPPQVSAGEPYVVKMYLLNEGDRIIWVDKMSVSMIVDGKPSARPMPSKTRTIRPRERGLLEELPGVWKAGVRSWVVEVVVTSKDHDVYRNHLSWRE